MRIYIDIGDIRCWAIPDGAYTYIYKVNKMKYCLKVECFQRTIIK